MLLFSALFFSVKHSHSMELGNHSHSCFGGISLIFLCYLTVAVQVTVKQGTLEGTVEQLVTGDGTYNSFKGIPYAKPPVGDLRFRPPQPPLPWTGVRNASEHGSICTQSNILTKVVTGTEDCLYLNVYTINLKPKSPQPVMVWIQGGGNNGGSGNVNNFGPDFLVTHDVVLVTFNFRVDSLGFLTLGTKDVQGNAGLKDQVAALQWVQDNINAFGGDPKNVTIFGESTGGAAVTLHMMSPMSTGLFQRGIAMSGTAFNEWAVPFEPVRRAFSLGKLLGLDTEDPDKLTAYLKTLNASQLVGLTPNVVAVEEYSRMITKMYQWTAVAETDGSGNNYLTDDPLSIMLNDGLVNDVDFMFGHTNDEVFSLYYYFDAKILGNYQKYTQLFAPKRIMDEATPETTLDVADELKSDYFNTVPVANATTRQLLNYINDCNYNYDIMKFGQTLPNNGNKRYLYQFSAVSDRNYYGNIARARYNTTGAGHLDDLFYMFDVKAFGLTIKPNSTEARLVKQFCTLITNFAKYGDPTPQWITDSALGTVTWPVYNPEDEQPAHLDFGTDAITPSIGLDSEAIGFFDNVYAISGVGYGEGENIIASTSKISKTPKKTNKRKIKLRTKSTTTASKKSNVKTEVKPSVKAAPKKPNSST